ncbi:MAG: hypothetical protein K5879_04675, partial [Lachnospiraceae bacterium]|nr:hypothetical protein [Lachnospiraceae bacterium]
MTSKFESDIIIKLSQKQMTAGTLTNEQQCNPENSKLAMSNAGFGNDTDSAGLPADGCGVDEDDSAKHV